MKLTTRAMVCLLLALAVANPATAQNQSGAITVFTAKKIVTIDYAFR
jgi:hypothetical protein